MSPQFHLNEHQLHFKRSPTLPSQGGSCGWTHKMKMGTTRNQGVVNTSSFGGSFRRPVTSHHRRLYAHLGCFRVADHPLTNRKCSGPVDNPVRRELTTNSNRPIISQRFVSSS